MEIETAKAIDITRGPCRCGRGCVPANLSSTTPDNRIDTARLLLRLRDFITLFTKRHTQARLASGTFGIYDQNFCLRADLLQNLLSWSARAVLCVCWGSVAGRTVFKILGRERVLLNGDARRWKSFVKKGFHVLGGNEREGNGRLVKETWFERNFERDLKMGRMYWRKVVYRDGGALNVALFGLEEERKEQPLRFMAVDEGEESEDEDDGGVRIRPMAMLVAIVLLTLALL